MRPAGRGGGGGRVPELGSEVGRGQGSKENNREVGRRPQRVSPRSHGHHMEGGVIPRN